MSEVFTADFVLARWAYSELLSPTQGERYKPHINPDLLANAQHQTPFDQLSCEDRSQLRNAWGQVRGAQIFNQALNGFEQFGLTEWTRNELAASYVIPMFAGEVGDPYAPCTFEHWIETPHIGELHEHHARDALPSDFRANHEPAFAVRISLATALGANGQAGGYAVKSLMLLDGYHRAVSLWRHDAAGDRLRIYVPEIQS